MFKFYAFWLFNLQTFSVYLYTSNQSEQGEIEPYYYKGTTGLRYRKSRDVLYKCKTSTSEASPKHDTFL